jgi:hypothetical protein
MLSELPVERLDGSLLTAGQRPSALTERVKHLGADVTRTSACDTSATTAAAVTTTSAERRGLPWGLNPASGATVLLGAGEKQRTPT